MTPPHLANRPVFLTGFMGSGKSYTGQRLAAQLGRSFIDLDERIESTAGKTISAIFADDGEAAFRAMEKEALRRCADDGAAIIATGGGAPCFHEGMDWMNAHGFTVFLDPSPAILFARLAEGRAHRPLLQDEAAFHQGILERLATRRPVYEKAQLQLRITKADAAVDHYLATYFKRASPVHL